MFYKQKSETVSIESFSILKHTLIEKSYDVNSFGVESLVETNGRL